MIALWWSKQTAYSGLTWPHNFLFRHLWWHLLKDSPLKTCPLLSLSAKFPFFKPNRDAISPQGLPWSLGPELTRIFCFKMLIALSAIPIPLAHPLRPDICVRALLSQLNHMPLRILHTINNSVYTEWVKGFPPQTSSHAPLNRGPLSLFQQVCPELC